MKSSKWKNCLDVQPNVNCAGDSDTILIRNVIDPTEIYLGEYNKGSPGKLNNHYHIGDVPLYLCNAESTIKKYEWCYIPE